MAKESMHGKRGGMHGEGGHVWYACPPFYEIQPVNAWAVHILLECILVVIVIVASLSVL